MKRLIVITGVILVVYLVLVTVVTQEADAPAAVGVQQATESGYRIGASEGRVAVFRDGNLYLRTDTTLSSLPKSDRNRLEQGINVDSLKELKSLLEDYCS